MKLTIVVETMEDLPEDAPYDCMDAVKETLKEYDVNVEKSKFEIQS